MMTILANIGKFLTDPKNTRMILLGVAVIFLLLFLNQCNRTAHFKDQVEIEKQEQKRITNNYEAAQDSIEQYQVDEDTWRAEKKGYELKVDELEGDYADLLGDFEIEKNRPPKTIVKTEYVVVEKIDSVLVTSTELDSNGNGLLSLSDTARYNQYNYRYLTGKVPYKFIWDPIDSTYRMVPDYGTFDLTLGMNLNVGLFQDKDTREISIQVDTDYPGVTFTNIEGASIMDDPDNKKVLRQLRKPWGLGINVGYGITTDLKNGTIGTGPYIGIGISYSPKFLQWGK